MRSLFTILIAVLLVAVSGCVSSSAINAIGERWPDFDVPQELEYSAEEKTALEDFINGFKALSLLEKRLADSGVTLTAEETATIKRAAQGNQALARKIVSRGQALRGAIEKYRALRWDNEENRLKLLKMTDTEIQAALGPRPGTPKIIGASVSVDKDQEKKTIKAEANG